MHCGSGVFVYLQMGMFVCLFVCLPADGHAGGGGGVGEGGERRRRDPRSQRCLTIIH